VAREAQGSVLPFCVFSSFVFPLTPCSGMSKANVSSPVVLSHLLTNYDCKATSIQCKRSLCLRWAQLFSSVAAVLMHFLCPLAMDQELSILHLEKEHFACV